jgi:hypothetical protein
LLSRLDHISGPRNAERLTRRRFVVQLDTTGAEAMTRPRGRRRAALPYWQVIVGNPLSW